MGLIRKMTSVSTLGLVDYRSDKERTASYTKRSAREARKQTAIQTAQLEQMRVNQLDASAAAPSGPPPGWYQAPHDPAGVARWWDGACWGDQTQQQNSTRAALPQPELVDRRPRALEQHSAATPEGWYPCPSGEHRHRWWDGSQWTEDTADAD